MSARLSAIQTCSLEPWHLNHLVWCSGALAITVAWAILRTCMMMPNRRQMLLVVREHAEQGSRLPGFERALTARTGITKSIIVPQVALDFHSALSTAYFSFKLGLARHLCQMTWSQMLTAWRLHAEQRKRPPGFERALTQATSNRSRGAKTDLRDRLNRSQDTKTNRCFLNRTSW